MYNTIPNNPFPPSSANVGGSSESYVLPIASADTLGGVKVGARMSIVDGVLSADKQLADYSTNEQSTGQKWYDGKELYLKVLVFDSAVSIKNNEWFNSNIDATGVANIVNVVSQTGDGACCPLVGALDNGKFIFLSCRVDSSFSAKTIFLYYTKTESEG